MPLALPQRIVVIESFLAARNKMIQKGETVGIEKSETVGQWGICELREETDSPDQDFVIEASECVEEPIQIELRSFYEDRIEDDIMQVTSELRIMADQLTHAPVPKIVAFCLNAPHNGDIRMILKNNS